MNNEISPISNTKKNLIEFKRIHHTLSKNHQELFKIKKSPLAHDIREQILDAYPEFENKYVLKFLRYIFSTPEYLEAMALNVERVRYNLNGTTTSFISTEHRKAAANHLAKKLNNYHTEKGLKRFTTEQRTSYFNSLESLDHRFETERYSIEHDLFKDFLLQENKSNEKDKTYQLSESMWPNNF